MKKITLLLLSLLLLTSVSACNNTTSTTNSTNQTNNQESSEQILKDYFAFIEKFDAQRIGDIRIELTNPELNQKTMK